MAYRETELGYLVRNRPREAAAQIRKALDKYAGNVSKVAEVLGVDVRTLTRWMRRLERGTKKPFKRRRPGNPTWRGEKQAPTPP